MELFLAPQDSDMLQQGRPRISTSSLPIDEEVKTVPTYRPQQDNTTEESPLFNNKETFTQAFKTKLTKLASVDSSPLAN